MTTPPVECRAPQEILSLKRDQPCKNKNTMNKEIEIRVDVGTIAEPR